MPSVVCGKMPELFGNSRFDAAQHAQDFTNCAIRCTNCVVMSMVCRDNPGPTLNQWTSNRQRLEVETNRFESRIGCGDLTIQLRMRHPHPRPNPLTPLRIPTESPFVPDKMGTGASIALRSHLHLQPLQLELRIGFTFRNILHIRAEIAIDVRIPARVDPQTYRLAVGSR